MVRAIQFSVIPVETGIHLWNIRVEQAASLFRSAIVWLWNNHHQLSPEFVTNPYLSADLNRLAACSTWHKACHFARTLACG